MTAAECASTWRRRPNCEHREPITSVSPAAGTVPNPGAEVCAGLQRALRQLRRLRLPRIQSSSVTWSRCHYQPVPESAALGASDPRQVTAKLLVPDVLPTRPNCIVSLGSRKPNPPKGCGLAIVAVLKPLLLTVNSCAFSVSLFLTKAQAPHLSPPHIIPKPQRPTGIFCKREECSPLPRRVLEPRVNLSQTTIHPVMSSEHLAQQLVRYSLMNTPPCNCLGRAVARLALPTRPELLGTNRMIALDRRRPAEWQKIRHARLLLPPP